jgi:hypothetical protein
MWVSPTQARGSRENLLKPVSANDFLVLSMGGAGAANVSAFFKIDFQTK